MDGFGFVLFLSGFVGKGLTHLLRNKKPLGMAVGKITTQGSSKEREKAGASRFQLDPSNKTPFFHVLRYSIHVRLHVCQDGRLSTHVRIIT